MFSYNQAKEIINFLKKSCSEYFQCIGCFHITKDYIDLTIDLETDQFQRSNRAELRITNDFNISYIKFPHDEIEDEYFKLISEKLKNKYNKIHREHY